MKLKNRLLYELILKRFSQLGDKITQKPILSPAQAVGFF